MGAAYDLWTGVVSARLEDYTGRGLADAPTWITRALPEWWQRGFSAAWVAERLAVCRWARGRSALK
jgi:hypothetical protein